METKEDADYNHKIDNTIEACGLTEERIEDIQNLVFVFIKESHNISEICEKIEKSLTKRELAFIVTQQAIDHYQEAYAKEFFNSLFNTMNISNCGKERIQK
jgi:molecular chaperone DnaK (HSP70)